MKNFLRVLAIFAIIFIAFAIYVATRPSEYEVKRTIVIKAPLSLVYNTVNEYKTWSKWGPWRENDETFTSEFPKETSGKNSGYSWTSRFEGNGNIKTIDLSENKFINQTIFTVRRGEANSIWQFESVAEGTKVTWTKNGTLDFNSKAFFTTMGDSELVFGDVLHITLRELDKYIIQEMDKYSITNNGVVEYNGGYFVHLTTECSFEEMGAKLDKMLPEVLLYSIRKGYPRAGNIFTLYHKYDEKNKRVEFSSCIPVKERVNPDGAIALAYMEKERYHKTTLQGAYKYSEEAWTKAFEFAKEDGIKISENGKPFEVYRKGHTDSENPANWVTEIYLPIE